MKQVSNMICLTPSNPFSFSPSFCILRTHLVVDDLGRVEVNEAIDLSRTLNVIGHGKGRVASGMEGEGSESRSRSKEGEGEDSDGLHDDIGVK